MAHPLLNVRITFMNTTELQECPPEMVTDTCLIDLPLGMLGFERIKRFALIANPGEEPFRWLQVPDDPSLAFLLVPPFDVLPEYEPELPPEDVDFLELDSPGDALMFNIVTLRANGHATANLKGPIVVNRHTLRGKQVVLANAANWSLRHPLPSAD